MTAVNEETSSFDIKLAFSNPEELSATSQPEYIKLDFNYPEYFRSIKGNPLATKNAVKVIPPQWRSEQARIAL